MKSLIYTLFLAVSPVVLLYSCDTNNGAKANSTYTRTGIYVISDSVIDVPIYCFEDTNMIKHVVDSTVLYNAFPSMNLFCFDEFKEKKIVSLYHRPLSLDDFVKIEGIYYSSSNIPVFIYNIGTPMLSELGLKNTGKRAILKHAQSFPEQINTYLMGYNAQFTIKNDSTIDYGLGFYGQSVFEDSIAAKQYAWLYHPSEIENYQNNANKKQNERDRRYRHLYKLKKEGAGQDIRINANHDTIFSSLNYGFIVEEDKDSSFVLPVYRFDNTLDGEIMSNLCDTIAKYNIFYQLWIQPRKESSDKHKILISYSILPLSKRENITGVILNDKKDTPIFLENFTSELQDEYGIVPTEDKITVYLYGDRSSWPADALGYYAWVSKTINGLMYLHLEFEGRPLDTKLIKPFEWLYYY